MRPANQRSSSQHYTQTKTNEEIYKSLALCMRTAASRSAGAFRHLASADILHLELAPYLNRIIAPPLRPVNSQVIRPTEKALLSRLVALMANLELRFVQEKTEEGQLVYRLDPPVDVFVTYDGKRAADIAVSRYAVRHLVAAEVGVFPSLGAFAGAGALTNRCAVRSMRASSRATPRGPRKARRARPQPSLVAGELSAGNEWCSWC